MRTLLTNKDISLDAIKIIMKCYIWSTLLYGSKTWAICTAMYKHIEAAVMWQYRRMLEIPWTDKTTNAEEVMRRANTKES